MKTKTFLTAGAIALAAGVTAQPQPDTARQWEEAFLTPPLSASPGCYYYWDTDNISKEGITKDLEAMKAVGIHEPFVANVVGRKVPAGSVKAFTDEWWDCMVHAANEAKRLGMHIGYFNCPGWSQSGGPWVSADKTMRYLVQKEVRKTGKEAGTVRIDLRKAGLPVNFRLVRVQAFPAPVCDSETFADLQPAITATGMSQADRLFDGNHATIATAEAKDVDIDIRLKQAQTARSIAILPTTRPMVGHWQLLAETGNGQWQTVCEADIHRAKDDAAVGPMREGALTAGFKAVTSDHFRLKITSQPNLKLREISISPAARLTQITEKQLGKLWPYPTVTADSYNWPASVQPSDSSLTVDPQSVADLTVRVGKDSTITWNAPKGDWIVLITGTAPTEVRNSPCTKEATGYEIDKLDKAAAEEHFDSFIGRLLAKIPPESRSAVAHVVIDSYEKGSQNWTDSMAPAFRRAYGYDPYPFLPALTGRIVGSAERSERFLWDLRRLVADLIATEYIGGLRERCHANGLKLWMENYGHWGYPGEFLNYGGAGDEVAGEFWLSKPERGPVEIRCASSAAHTYGKPRVSCESFTDSRTNFRTLPADLKARGDWALCQGANHYVMHVYLHQPDDRKPGFCAWFGTDFNRNNTWFSKAKPYFDYLRRTSALLQRGSHVADVAYFIGEDTPKMTGERTPEIPAGYDYDFINAEVLMQAEVGADGRIRLPSGANYAVLALPTGETMRPEMAHKVLQLITAGATVVGLPPRRSPSMEGYPACDATVDSLGRRMVEAGLVTKRNDMKKVMEKISLEEDCLLPAGMLYTHREQDGCHAYFVSNQEGDSTRTVTARFRVGGMVPELWDAVTGKTSVADNYHSDGATTTLTMRMPPNGSVFVVFRKNGAGASAGDGKQAKSVPVASLDGAWEVTFTPSYADAFKVRLDSLADWTKSDNNAIKYFSGSATYRKSFKYRGEGKGRTVIDLGSVGGIAKVTVNGTETPALWTPPYRTDITGSLRKGTNTIEVEVTNCWWNRLVGDSKPGATHHTWTTNKTWNSKSKLLPSGLKGPVVVYEE